MPRSRQSFCAAEVPADRHRSYGSSLREQQGALTEVRGLIETPARDAPSRLGVIASTFLQPEVMDLLGAGEKGAGRNPMNDAIAKLIGDQLPRLEGRRRPPRCGDKAGSSFAKPGDRARARGFARKIREFLAAR